MPKQNIAFVTGAGSGIGRSTALELATSGHFVVSTDINLTAAEETAEEINRNGGSATSFQLDISNSEQYQEVVSSVETDFGYLSKAVNSAGISPKPGRLGTNKLDEWNKVVEVNLIGTFIGMKHQISSMIKNGTGSIVNLASIHGLVATTGSSSYVASKHGVIGATKAAALEYASKNIRINAISPGYVDTPLLKDATDESIQILISKHPLGRLATSAEIAGCISFLLSDTASFMTGSVLVVDGGYSLS